MTRIIMDVRAAIRTIRQKPAASAIIAIIIMAFGLRIWAIWFGLPFLFHNDESSEVLRALQLGTGSFDFDRISKGGYYFVLFVEFGFLFVALNIAGIIGSANDFAVYFIREPALFYLAGRATTAVLGAATVYVVYLIGKRAYSPLAGVCAAAFLAVNVLHAELSHYITVDVPMVFLATATLYFGIRIIERGDKQDYVLAALVASMSAATKLPSVLLLPTLLLAHILSVYNKGGDWRKYVLMPMAWQAVGIFLTVYVVLTPGILVNFGPMMEHFLNVFGAGGGSAESATAGTVPLVRPNLFGFYATKIMESMTVPVFAICIAGVLYALWSRRQADLVLLTFGLLVYVVMSLSSDKQLFFPRYILPLVPVMAILGGRLVAILVDRLPENRQTNVAAIVILALIVLPAIKIGENNRLSLQTDTRALAKEWFDENASDGDSVFIEGFRGSLYKGSVPLRHSAENIREIIQHYKDTEPGKARYFRMALEAIDGKTFDIVGVPPDELRSLDHYKSLGVRYFVLRPESYVASRLRQHWVGFVDAVEADPDISLAARFAPVERVTPGPLIEIYRLEPGRR